MSLYNTLHGYNKFAGVVLELLRIEQQKIPRFRDAYFTYRDDEKTEPMMVILTRTGGANRENYVAGNDYLRSLPGFINDQDDESDKSYALFNYTLTPAVPEESKLSVLRLLEITGKPPSLREKTQQALNNPTPEQQAAREKIAETLKAAFASGENRIIEI